MFQCFSLYYQRPTLTGAQDVKLSVSQPAARLSAAAANPATGISPAAVTHSPLDPNTVEQLRLNMQVSFMYYILILHHVMQLQISYCNVQLAKQSAIVYH